MRRPADVVVMCAPSDPGSSFTITQEDLAEERMLSQQARAAMDAHSSKRRMIRQALESGARLEPGLRSARIETRRMLVIR
jgi:hypothetical protein